MSDKLILDTGCDANDHGLSSADINDPQEGIEIAGTAKTGTAPNNHRTKVYARPELKQIGCLSTLIMGQSGAGIDSVARREF
jgi:hypothetical protein